MTKIFYDHLILIDELFIEVEALDMPKNHKQQVRRLIDEITTQRVITYLLDLLPHAHHEEFLKRVHAAPHDTRHLAYLQELVTVDVQSELIRLGELIKKELRAELKKHTAKK